MEKLKKKRQREYACHIARSLCANNCQERINIDPAIIISTCEYVSSLCLYRPNKKCKEQSKLCKSASDALKEGDEEKYLEICEKAIESCPYQTIMRKKMKKEKKNNKKSEFYVS